jgi:hypothetical protein
MLFLDVTDGPSNLRKDNDKLDRYVHKKLNPLTLPDTNIVLMKRDQEHLCGVKNLDHLYSKTYELHCHKCEVFYEDMGKKQVRFRGAKLLYVRTPSESKDYLCRSCYNCCPELQKKMYRAATWEDFQAFYGLIQKETSSIVRKPVSALKAINRELYPLKLVAIAHHSEICEDYSFSKLNVLNVFHQGQKLGTNILNSFRDFGVANRINFRISLSRLNNLKQFKFYLRNCLIDPNFYIIDDDQSCPVMLHNEETHLNEVNDAEKWKQIHEVVKLIQKALIYRRFNKVGLQQKIGKFFFLFYLF